MDQHLVAERSIELALCKWDHAYVTNLKSGVGCAELPNPYTRAFDESFGWINADHPPLRSNNGQNI
jgi:hypothetical protein